MVYLLICFNTLWIYTALKHFSDSPSVSPVSIPSEFTLLSNKETKNKEKETVSIPSEFTLLSNAWLTMFCVMGFQYPLNLHCSQTVSRCNMDNIRFNTLWIYTALKHLSALSWAPDCFNTLWIYTALKHHCFISCQCGSFNTLWIYTALKPVFSRLAFFAVSIPSEFTLLSNYTILQTARKGGFNTLWIYTALKPSMELQSGFLVSIPSEFTLLSNFW